MVSSVSFVVPTPQQMGIAEQVLPRKQTLLLQKYVIGDSGHCNGMQRKCYSAV